MRESRTYGFVRGALSNGRPYRNRLNALPGYLRLRLSGQLACRCGSVAPAIDRFQAQCDDEEAVQRVAEAAADDRSMLDTSATGDAELMDDISGAAENTRQLLSALDTTTAGAGARGALDQSKRVAMGRFIEDTPRPARGSLSRSPR